MNYYIGAVLAHLYPEADPLDDYEVRTEEGNTYIAHWDTDKLGIQPTEAELDAAWVKTRKTQRKNELAVDAQEFIKGSFHPEYEMEEIVALVLEAVRTNKYDVRLDKVLNAFGNLNVKKKDVDAVDETAPDAIQQINNVVF